MHLLQPGPGASGGRSPYPRALESLRELVAAVAQLDGGALPALRQLALPVDAPADRVRLRYCLQLAERVGRLRGPAVEVVVVEASSEEGAGEGE